MENVKLEKIIKINSILEKAFGKGFKGNIIYEGNNYDGMWAMMQCYELKNIHKDTLLTRLSFFFLGVPKNVGWFSDGNPREINVRKKYIKEGKLYAKFYEEETRLNVNVTELGEDSHWRIL